MPAAMALLVLGHAPLPEPLHQVFAAVNFVNPLVHYEINDATILEANHAAVLGHVSALLVIAVVGLTAGLAQWRRLEA